MNRLDSIKKVLIKKTGFTIVELLVAVAVVAILATIGLVIFSTTQRDARDSRRRADVDAIAKALETKKAIAGYAALADPDFSSGTVPADSSPAKYSILTGTAAISNPTTWDAANAQPTVAAGDPAWVTVASGIPTGSPTYWKVCARLEKSTAASLQVYCRGNAQ